MCDTFVVVEEGRVIFGKNSDRDPNEAQLLTWADGGEHSADASVRCTWSVIPQARRTHAIVVSRPYWGWGAEMGANERGVCVGNEAVFTRSKATSKGLTGMDLVRLVLERAGSAEEGVATLRSLLRKHGQGGRAGYVDASFRYDNSFIIADATEAWVVETAGHELVTERITRGTRAISNGLTIEPFASKHSDRLRTVVAQAAQRRHHLECAAHAARTPHKAMAALRGHGVADVQGLCPCYPGRGSAPAPQRKSLRDFLLDGIVGGWRVDSGGLGTRVATGAEAMGVPTYSRLTGAMGAPCMHAGGLLASAQTVGSWVSVLGSSGAQHWATGTSAPCLSVFKPLRLDEPLSLGAPSGRADDRSLWWRFERLHRLALRDLSGVPDAMRDEARALEAAAVADPAPSASHWAEFINWVDRWTLILESQPLPESRPAWLRRRWERWDQQASEAARLPPRAATTRRL